MVIRTMVLNQEDFFGYKIDKYKQLCLDKGGTHVKLTAVMTPCIKESPNVIQLQCANGADMPSP